MNINKTERQTKTPLIQYFPKMPEEIDTHLCVCPKNLTVVLSTYFLLNLTQISVIQQLSPPF